MGIKSGFLVVCLLATAFGAPQLEQQAADIESSDVGYFFQNTRIVGGENAPDGSVPFIAAISSGSVFRSLVCGASLISPRHFLTAAHCIVAVQSCGIITGCSVANSVRLHVGSNRWNSGDTRYSVSGDVTHPGYVSSTIKNDIGVLISATDVVLGNTVQIVPLSYDYIGGGELVQVAGWGRIAAGASAATDLKRLFVETITGEECSQQVRNFAAANNINAPHIDDVIEICTFHGVGDGTCNGDSGSPLVLVESGEQVGAVSWGFPCAIGAPDMFARVSGFREFLLGALDTL